MKVLPFKANVDVRHSVIIQKMIFSYGYTWIGGHKNIFNNDDAKFLYFGHPRYDMGLNLMRGGQRTNFFEANLPIITYEEFMSLYRGRFIKFGR